MRLYRMRLCAVGPFAGEQVVNFEPLGAGGLFLLDGPTGAGKSTVLDAITFALYGPGEGGGWGRLHSQFAAPGVEPQVQLEFALRGVRQRVTRSPEYLRPRRRGTGSTREAARVHLERWEGDAWVTRSSNKAEVGELLNDDLGLSREQFTQVVLLPQGEFMRFLRANDDERRALLTKLFGTQLYDRITDELDRRRAVVSRDTDLAEKRLSIRIGAAAQAGGLNNAQQDELVELDGAARELRLRCVAEGLAAAATEADSLMQTASERLGELRSAADRAELRAAQARRVANAEAAQLEHERGRADYDCALELLAAAERAEPVRPLIAACTTSSVALSAALRVVQECDADSDGSADLDRGTELRARAAAAVQLAAELNSLVARERHLIEGREQLAAAEAAVVQARAALDLVAVRLRELPTELSAVEDEIALARDYAAALAGLVDRHEVLTIRLGALRALTALDPDRDAAQRGRASSVECYAAAVDRHLQLVQARLANMAAELAVSLVDGRPCAVCGAREHPEPALPAAGAPDADAVARAARNRAVAEQERDDALAKLTEVEKRRTALLATLAGHAPDEGALSVEIGTLVEKIAVAKIHIASLDAHVQVKAALEVERQRVMASQQQAASMYAAAHQRHEAAERAVQELDDELAEATAGYASVAARQQALHAEAAAASALADAVDKASIAARAYDDSVRQTEREAALAGFASLDEAGAAIRPRSELDRLRTVTGQWLAMASSVRGALEAARAEAGAGDTVPQAATAAAKARVELDEGEATLRRLAAAADRARAAVCSFDTACTDLSAARDEYEASCAAAEPIVHLAKLAKGVAGQRRVALTTYVLRQWFEQVIAAANIRLSGMSSGRYELVRVDEGATKTERVGLTLQVLDRHTGEQRSARSLSGGETFYTSLSLALGLADVVRAEAGGVDLDTLFIDEGFGSLDAETLDQVMAVIDELRDRGRTVGIVSHVSELKERISERIEVRRLPDGSSSLRVVA